MTWRMARAALTLELLAKQWRQGSVDALTICGHPHGRVAAPGTAQASQTDRWFYCLYGRREARWEVVREAHTSAMRGRTWWSLDQCLQALASRQVVPTELRLLPRGPAPPDFPKLPVETAPTESRRRKAAAGTPLAATAPPPSRGAAGWLGDPGDAGAETASTPAGGDVERREKEEGGWQAAPG